MLWPKTETTAVLKPTLSLPKLFAAKMLRVSGPDDSLESNTDQRTKLHIHLCMCSIVRHVHSLNRLQGGKVWLLLGSHFSNTVKYCPPPPVPPATTRGALKVWETLEHFPPTVSTGNIPKVGAGLWLGLGDHSPGKVAPLE